MELAWKIKDVKSRSQGDAEVVNKLQELGGQEEDTGF